MKFTNKIFNRYNNGNNSDINISPLIDVTFILLIFFMVSTTFLKDIELKIERPNSKSGDKIQNSIRVVIDRQNNVYIESKLVNPWVFQTKLGKYLVYRTLKNVLIVADKDVKTEKLIEIVDQCKLAGAESVGVSVKEKNF